MLKKGDEIQIEIHQEHIERGCIQHHHACPIALALSEVVSGPIAVAGTHVDIKEGYTTFSGNLPRKIQDFILEFDQEMHIKHPENFKERWPTPIKFTLRITRRNPPSYKLP